MVSGWTLAACLLLAGCTPPSGRAGQRTEAVDLPAPAGLAPAVAVAEPEPEPDWAQELEWARGRFPELRDFVLDVDIQPLLAWVPRGKEVTLFFRARYTLSSGKEERYDCVAADAAYGASEDGDYISLLIPEPEQIVRGQTVRRFDIASATKRGVFLGAGGFQRKLADGTWEKFDEYTAGFRQLGSSVGPVDGDTAHFYYAEMSLDASCGPFEKVRCEEGFEAECNACKTVTIDLSSTGMGSTHRLPMQCPASCPVVENPELDRAQRLTKHVKFGYVPHPGNPSVALYRTRVACETDTSWKPRAASAP